MSANQTYGYGPAPGNLAATAFVACNEMQGIFCSSSTSGTLTIYDGNSTATADKVIETFTAVAGTFHVMPFRSRNGGFNFVVGGTIKFTPACN